MAEYIEREALMVKLVKVFEPVNDVDTALFLNKTLRTINFFPAADVVEVVYGSWIYVNGNCGCSVCRQCLSYDGNSVILDLSHLPYCPHCGAKMGGDTDG